MLVVSFPLGIPKPTIDLPTPPLVTKEISTIDSLIANLISLRAVK